MHHTRSTWRCRRRRYPVLVTPMYSYVQRAPSPATLQSHADATHVPPLPSWLASSPNTPTPRAQQPAGARPWEGGSPPPPRRRCRASAHPGRDESKLDQRIHALGHKREQARSHVRRRGRSRQRAARAEVRCLRAQIKFAQPVRVVAQHWLPSRATGRARLYSAQGSSRQNAPSARVAG